MAHGLAGALEPLGTLAVRLVILIVATVVLWLAAIDVRGISAVSEVDLEDRVEGRTVILGLDQRGAQRRLEDQALPEVDL